MQQNVFRLDVAVDHAVAMGVVERPGDLGRDTDSFFDGELVLACQAVTQRLSLDVRHDVVDEAVGFP